MLVISVGCTDDSGDDQGTDDSTIEPDVGGGAETVDQAPSADETPIEAAVGPILGDTGEGLAGVELEAHLARRFEAFWVAFDLARQAPSAEPELDYPELAALAAGELLEVAHEELRELHATGHAIRAAETAAVDGLDADSTHRIRVDRLEIGVAELESCQVNDRVRYAVSDDEILTDSVLTARTRSTMAVADGSWKVIRSEPIELEIGVAGCWLEAEEAFPY